MIPSGAAYSSLFEAASLVSIKVFTRRPDNKEYGWRQAGWDHYLSKKSITASAPMVGLINLTIYY